MEKKRTKKQKTCHKPDGCLEFDTAGGNMSTLHKYVLRKNRVTLKEELELSVVDYLVSNGVFTLAHSEDILAEKTRRDKAGRLLDLLEGRGSTAFDALVDGLTKTQKHLADSLEKWAVKAAKIDEKAITKFIYDDDIMKDKAGLALKIFKIRVEQRSEGSVPSVDFHVPPEYILGDENRFKLMCSRLQEFASIFSIQSGSITLLLLFETQTDLSKFWLSYNDGSLQKKLASVFVTEELRQKYPGAEFSLIMDVDIEQYIDTVRKLAAEKPHHEAAATESEQSSSDSESVDLLKKYAEIDMAIKLKYLHGEDDHELTEAQIVLEKRLFGEKDSKCMEALSQFLESRGMLLTDDSGTGLSRLQARTLDLSWLSQLDPEFSWSLDATQFASVLLNTSIMEAAKGHPLNISCYLKNVRVGHITSEEHSLWTRLKELREQLSQQSGRQEHAEVQRYLAELTCRPPTDATSETSGFEDDLEPAPSAQDVEPVADFPVPAAVDKPVYEIRDPEKKGYLVIINNSVFDNAQRYIPERKGSEKDVAMLHAVFTDLGFRVQVMHNLRAAEMVKVLARSAEKAGKSGASCFVSAILSHGSELGVLGTDDERVSTRELTDGVANITELAGIPKIFFIQASRGTMLDAGIFHKRNEAHVKPKTADLLVCNASAPGYHSLRNLTTGSWFVKAIEQVFTEYGKTQDVLSLMTRVGHVVSKQQSRSSLATIDVEKQMPVFESSLTKTLYFAPYRRQ